MTLSLTTVLSATITKSELDANFDAIQSKFSAGIDNSDIKAAAGISLTKLAAKNEYCLVTLETRGDAIGLTGADQLRDEVPFPGLDGTQDIWTLVAASWVCTDTGTASTAKFNVEWGKYAADGSYAKVDDLILEETLSFPSGGGTANSKQCTIDEAEVAFHASLSSVFRLVVDTTHEDALKITAGDIPATPQYLKVSLLLERPIQA